MAIIPQPHLFGWQEIDAASDLDRLRLVLETMPDEPLVQDLEKGRGRGRNDYPIRFVLNSLYAGVVYDHASIESLRRELQRNGELRCLCGFDPVLGATAVPSSDSYSNLLTKLLAMEDEVHAMFERLVAELQVELPDLGKRVAFDGKALPSWANGKMRSEPKDEAPLDEHGENDRRRDHDADWGRKSYRGTREDGTAWEKVKSWFGFELHLLADTSYELPLAYEVTKASVSEHRHILPLVDHVREEHPAIYANTRVLTADKGLDSTETINTLWEEHNILPVIDIRNTWRNGETHRLVHPEVADNVDYDAKGRVSCICRKTGERRPMAYWGFEEDRNTLKYRCPGRSHGVQCASLDQCQKKPTEYGRVVRVSRSINPRIFTPLARNSERWKDEYARRTGVERINSRIDNLLGFERHTIRGLGKMKVRMGMALCVLLAMALGRIRIGQADQMRSMVASVPRGPPQKAA